MGPRRVFIAAGALAALELASGFQSSSSGSSGFGGLSVTARRHHHLTRGPRLLHATSMADAAAAVNGTGYSTELEKDLVDVVSKLDADEGAIDATVLEPGMAENSKFTCDDVSVDFWQNFQRETAATALDNLREAASVAGKHLSEGPQAVEYWAKCAARTSYFLTNGLLGTGAYTLAERMAGNDEAEGIFGSVSGGSSVGIDTSIASRLLLEAALVYEQDWTSVAKGDLKMPWDMEAGHRQTTPQFALRQTGRFMREAVGTLRRRDGMKQTRTWLDDASQDSMGYPDYYLNQFHHQTDGWFSKESADVYETSTETLFLGRQDSMQRRTLVPLSKLSTKPGSILEVACGTGRVGTFTRDLFPEAEVTLSDLSPFYLDKARKNDAYWRQRYARSNGGGEPPAARLVQANAEKLPFEDASFDAVTCVYLFHELPAEARVNAAAEMARVVKPGGTVVFTDSIQRGDRPALDEGLDKFENLNEPHYPSYIRSDVPKYFEDAGLVCGDKSVASTSKTLSFTKPL